MRKKTKQLLSDREIARLVYVSGMRPDYTIRMPVCLAYKAPTGSVYEFEFSDFTLAMDVQRAIRKRVRSSVKLQEQIIAAKAREATLGD